ncbi:hypothetical protein [Pseudomonas putida]|uniref:hypothetical protein n=1 Tax=Pseudomonas putida TaxID=303 RepID=UPI0023671E01|nr:hypothetical protein [Pseudomonas putida]MDD2046622.1 hypothetical protein [Pseudomonas putida]
MDTNKDSTGNYSVWLPGSAVVLSLVISAFALTRDPFLETRPVGAQFQPQIPIEARLWQDPFDALERYRKRAREKRDPPAPLPCAADLPRDNAQLLVALVEDGAYAEAIELRRRTRYAILAGLKSARLVPEDEQHIGCFAMTPDLRWSMADGAVEIPYESFVSNPFEPALGSNQPPRPETSTRLLWLKQEVLKGDPLGQLERLRNALAADPGKDTLKVIGPADSAMLREIYLQEAHARYQMSFNGRDVEIPQLVEIYSPLATADKKLLMRGFDAKGRTRVTPMKKLKLLRTVSDDARLAQLLLEELKRRSVDPATGAGCAPPRKEKECFQGAGWRKANRVALISEWDSFYSRALIESFRAQVGDQAGLAPGNASNVDHWVLHFSYLRGLDGRLPEEAIAKTEQKTDKDHRELDLGPLERSDGNSQLDYLRRLADHIQAQDQAYRRANKNGIGAIGVMGLDTYDKLLVLQALKSRMPNKLYFSTDLDARMLQQGQAQVTRNLVLAAPYGLTLNRALQQDMPPFRDSLQSAVYISVLAALSPQPFKAKRRKFDYSRSQLLSPGIYEVGMSGFIALDSKPVQQRASNCAADGGDGSGKASYIRPQNIMDVDCLQDPSPPPYPQTAQALIERLRGMQSLFRAGPLALVLLMLGLLGWWSSNLRQANRGLRAWLPPSLYGAAAVTAWYVTRTGPIEWLWLSFGLIVMGLIGSDLNRRRWQHKATAAQETPLLSSTFSANAWYVLVPLGIFVLALLEAYKNRDWLTENGLGEPMFLFEGISAWPTLALRLLAVLICVAALLWGWRSLCLNRQEIEREFQLSSLMQRYRVGLWHQLRQLTRDGSLRPLHRLAKAVGLWLYHIFLPLSPNTPRSFGTIHDSRLQSFAGNDPRVPGLFLVYWREHCICGSFGARLLRSSLATWIFLVLTSTLFVLWPMDGSPTRGTLHLQIWSWLLPTLAFNLLVFWVVDANRLLTRFIRQLSNDFSIWPKALRQEHRRIFGLHTHACIDEWVGLTLVAKRTAAVSRLIYAPTLVLLILIASRSSLFDNWSTPPGMIITFALTGLILLSSALSLRWAAEKARTIGLQRIDQYLLETPDNNPEYINKVHLIRERIVALNTGAFSRYADEPLVRALLLSLTGIGGSAIVDALNYAKF